MRTLLLAIFVCLAACAETDPYRRADAAPTPALADYEVVGTFNARWPDRFKCVQVVTLDFGPVTRVLVGSLVVQRPGKFRLQGMSEQGLKLFDIIGVDGKLTIVQAAEEFDRKVLDSIARDVGRVFLKAYESGLIVLDNGFIFGDAGSFKNVRRYEVKTSSSSTSLCIEEDRALLRCKLVGNPPRVDWYAGQADGAALYRVDHYEWTDFGGTMLPSVIVLREEHDSPGYKLTLQITEFAARDQDWPEAVFAAGR